MVFDGSNVQNKMFQEIKSASFTAFDMAVLLDDVEFTDQIMLLHCVK